MPRPKKQPADADTAPADRLMPLAEAAARLSVSPQTIRRAIARGQIRGVRIGWARGVLRVSESEVMRLIARGTDPTE